MKLKTLSGALLAAALVAGLNAAPTHAAGTGSLCKVDPLKRGASFVSMSAKNACKLTYTSPNIINKGISRRANGIAQQANSQSTCLVNSSRGDSASKTNAASNCNVAHTTTYDGGTAVHVTYSN